MALAQIGRKYNAPQRIVEEVVEINADRQQKMAQKVIEACGGSVEGKKIGVLGVSFKPNTDDVRDAPSLVVIPILQEFGAVIAAHDPAAMEEAAKHLEEVNWVEDPYEVAQGADAVVILTEWNEYRQLSLPRLGETMKTKCLVDLRNIYKVADMEDKGFHYVSIGRREIKLPASLKAVQGA